MSERAVVKRNVLLSGVILAVFAVVVTTALLTSRADPRAPSSAGATAVTDGAAPGTGAAPESSGPAVVRPDSHRLGPAVDGGPTLVEFLDFECEACRAAYPVVEDLRREYAGQVNFVIRYFPIPSHANAINAAVAVEAAAQQGRLEEMYKRMYETQAEWGEQRDSKADVFRGFARDLGLDMAAYDRAVADPATTARVERDRDEGLALGVQGTPTFFLDGELLNPTSVEDFRAQIDAALAG